LTAQKEPAQSKDSSRLSTPENQTLDLRSVTTAAVSPTREDFKIAHQSALQGAAPQPAAVAEVMIPGDAIHHLDPSEIAASLRRGNDLIASGDIAAARLVLRRAANAGDAHAAMTLAGTYDPVILEKLGVHGFVPDVAMARVWYEKAKKFGSAEAPQRLELLANKRQ
jgi:TPR repeat protein